MVATRERERVLVGLVQVQPGQAPRGVLDLVLDLRERLVAAKRQRHRLAEAVEARVGLQAQEHHLALVDLAAGRDVGLGERQRVRDRLGALDPHRCPSPGRGRARAAG